MTTIKCLGVTYDVHPAADLFPLMDKAELQDLADDIKKRGLQEPIARDENDLILDGRNRLMACDIAKVKPEFRPLCDWPIEDAADFVIGANIHRRHLIPAQKTELIDKVLKLDPGKSNRQIAAQTKSSPTTVGKVRKKAEAKGDVSTVDTRTDTKGRKQPARKPPKTPSLMLVEAVKAKAKADEATVDAPVVKAKPGTIAPASTVALSNFIYACNTWLPKLDTADRVTARTHFQKWMARLNGQAEISIEEPQPQMAKIAESESAQERNVT